MIRVGIVDDHPLLRDGLAAGLAAQPDLELVWQAASLAEAQQALDRGAADIVIADVRLPDGSGLELLPGARPPLRPFILMMSNFDRPHYSRVAFARGAVGFLVKTAPIHEFLQAIRSVAAGGTAFDPGHVPVMIEAGPSERELDVIQLVVDGYSNDEIASRLDLSRKTVEAYLGRLYERWAASSRTELAVLAEREGWLYARRPSDTDESPA